MKKLLLILLSALSLTTVGQEYVQVHYPEMLREKVSVEIPKWFMDITDGTYVGISMPKGDETDAIGMALIQRLLATDVEIRYDTKDLIEQSQSEEISLTMHKGDVSFFVEIDFYYELQNLSKLPSGEYICRLTDGKKNSMHMKITFNEDQSLFESKTGKDKEAKYYRRINMTLEYGNHTYNMMINERNHNDSTYYQSIYFGDAEMYRYKFTNSFSDIGNDDAARMPYIFLTNQPKISLDDAYWAEGNYYYNVSPQKCLTEQLLVFYMDMIRKALPEDNSSGYIVRKKTPIVSQQYDDGTFIIKTTTEE